MSCNIYIWLLCNQRLFLAGLGPTVTELDVSQLKVFPKTRFSMLVPEVKEHLKKLGSKYIYSCVSYTMCGGVIFLFFQATYLKRA